MDPAGPRRLYRSPAIIESALMLVCLVLSIAGLRLATSTATAGVAGWLILAMCFIAMSRALWVRRGLDSKVLRQQALGISLVAFSFALVDVLVFMDGLGMNPVLNVNFGQGPLGTTLPIFVVAVITYWTAVSLMAARENKERIWLALFFVSFFVGIFVVNPLTGNGGFGIATVVILGSFCLHGNAISLAPRRPWTTTTSAPSPGL